MNENPVRVRDCKICLVPHDDEIHAATLDIHNWFNDQVTKNFIPDEPEQAPEIFTAA